MDFPDNIPVRELSTDLRHNLFLATKEALNNIVKHAQATEAWIRVQVTVRGLGLAIEIGYGSGSSGAQPVSSSAAVLTGNLLLNSGFEETKAGAPADKCGQYAGDEWRAELKGSTMVYLWQESAFAGRPKEGLPEFHSSQGALRTHAEKDCHT